jgi:dephospho-CoA kinase
VKDIRKFCPESILIGVDADPKVRFERVISRNSITDHVDFEQFKHEEEKESNGEKDTQMNLPKVMSMADIVVDNSKTLGEFEEEVRKKVFEHPFFVRLA